MPYIDLKTNVSTTPEQREALKASFGKAITAIPGKTEARLMVSIECGKSMWFKGEGEPCAMIEIALFGKSTYEAYNNLTALVSEAVEKELGVPQSRIYVKYEEVNYWGCGGANF